MKLTVPALLLAALASACSQSEHLTAPSPTPTGAGPQGIATNAPGGTPLAVIDSGASCSSVIPSYRVESDWPKAQHLSFDWGHNGAAIYTEFVLTRREDNRPPIVVKPNEHTNGAGAVSHHTEQAFELGIYDLAVTYIYPTGCRSRTATFSGLNHGVMSLTGVPEVRACWSADQGPRSTADNRPACGLAE